MKVLSEDSASTLRWLRLDCSTLKQQLVTLCDGWVAAFVALLSNLASRQLSTLSEELPRHIAELLGRSGQCTAPPKMGAALQDSASARQDEELPGQLELQQSDLNAEGVEAGLEGGTEAEAEAEVEVAPMLAQAEGTTQLGSAPEQLGGQVPMTAEERQAAAERLEALHGRLEGEREELEQRIADCQEKYGALVNLQVGGSMHQACWFCKRGVQGRASWQVGVRLLQDLTSMSVLWCRPRCLMQTWSESTTCPCCGTSLLRRWMACLPACVRSGPDPHTMCLEAMLRGSLHTLCKQHRLGKCGAGRNVRCTKYDVLPRLKFPSDGLHSLSCVSLSGSATSPSRRV